MSASYNSDESSSSKVVNETLRQEVHRSIFALPFEPFLKSFLYHPNVPTTLHAPGHPPLSSPSPNSDTEYEDDRDIADQCPKKLKAAPKALYKSGKFSLPEGNENSLYKPLTTLMESIGDFYRTKCKSVDAAWPKVVEAHQPSRPGTRRTSRHRDGPSLTRARRFYDTHSKTPKFSRPSSGRGVKPDISLMLVSGPNAAADPHWKDIRVAVEVKRAGTAGERTEDLAIQVASYARAMKLEKFDRKFFYTVSISRTTFRVWRWDAACAYVSDPVNYHDHPVSLIMLIQRLISLDPAGLGYDTKFSNAGTAIHSDNVPVVLNVTRSNHHRVASSLIEPEYRFDHLDDAGGPTETMAIALEPEMLFEARGPLFCRNTRAFQGVEVKADGAPSSRFAIKQTWQDDMRTPEPVFRDHTKGIASIPGLVTYEVLDSTREVFRRVSSSIRGWYERDTALRADGVHRVPIKFRSAVKYPFPKICHRFLLRLVFDAIGRSLWNVESPLTLLKVMLCVVQAIRELRACHLLHRDISFGNILVSDKLSVPGMLIDLGLSQLLPDRKQSGNSAECEDRPRPHHRLTGTLPYMAHDILELNHDPEPSKHIQHDVQHDLESVFWVMLYICLKSPTRGWSPSRQSSSRIEPDREGDAGEAQTHADDLDQNTDQERAEPTTTPVALQDSQVYEALIILAKLESADPGRVADGKLSLLFNALATISGRFASLHPFLSAFRLRCFQSLVAIGVKVMTCDDIESLMLQAIQDLEHSPPLPITHSPSRPPASPKRIRGEEEDPGLEDKSPRSVRRRVTPSPSRTPLRKGSPPRTPLRAGFVARSQSS